MNIINIYMIILIELDFKLFRNANINNPNLDIQ